MVEEELNYCLICVSRLWFFSRMVDGGKWEISKEGSESVGSALGSGVGALGGALEECRVT